MLNVLEEENYRRILREMSQYEMHDGFSVGCIVGESRFLENVNYMFFDYELGANVESDSVETSQFIVLQFTHPTKPPVEGEEVDVDDTPVVTFHPIFANGSFLVNGAVVSDCALVLSEAFANFKENIARTSLDVVLTKMEIDVPHENELPEQLANAFTEAAPRDTTHGLRFIDKNIKVFTDYIGL